MFDLPNAKRIRRDELISRESASPSPSPPPESAFEDAHDRLGKLLKLDCLITPEQPMPSKEENQNQTQEEQDNDEEQEFEFRLFSAPTKKSTAAGGKEEAPEKSTKADGAGGTQKLRIRLRSPTPTIADLGEGRFVNPFRGWSYYFTTEALYTGSGSGSKVSESEGERKAQFEDVAVSGQDLMGWAKQAWPGCHLPWRVMHFKRQYAKLPPGSGDVVVCKPDPPVKTSPKTRKKPGKKRRVQLRKRLTAAEDAKEKEAEKRNRKNRERKIKRRQKAREQKAAAAVAKGEDPPAEMDEDSSEGDD